MWTNQSGVVDFLNQLEKNGMIQLQRHVEDEGQGETEPLAGQSVEQTLASLGLSPAQPKEECAVSELFQKTVALVKEIAQLRLEVEQLENKRMNKPAMWELPLLKEESSLSTRQDVFDVFEVDMVDLQDDSTYLVTDQHQELHHGQDFQPEVPAAASLVAVPQELHSGQDDNPPPPVAVLEASLGQGHSTSDFSRGDVVLAVADTPAATVPKGDPYLRLMLSRASHSQRAGQLRQNTSARGSTRLHDLSCCQHENTPRKQHLKQNSPRPCCAAVHQLVHRLFLFLMKPSLVFGTTQLESKVPTKTLLKFQ